MPPVPVIVQGVPVKLADDQDSAAPPPVTKNGPIVVVRGTCVGAESKRQIDWKSKLTIPVMIVAAAGIVTISALPFLIGAGVAAAAAAGGSGAAVTAAASGVAAAANGAQIAIGTIAAGAVAGVMGLKKHHADKQNEDDETTALVDAAAEPINDK